MKYITNKNNNCHRKPSFTADYCFSRTILVTDVCGGAVRVLCAAFSWQPLWASLRLCSLYSCVSTWRRMGFDDAVCVLCAAFSWRPPWASLRLWSLCSCCGSTWWLTVSLPLPLASTPLTWTSCRSPHATPGRASSPAGSSSATWLLEVRTNVAWRRGGRRRKMTVMMMIRTTAV